MTIRDYKTRAVEAFKEFRDLGGFEEIIGKSVGCVVFGLAGVGMLGFGVAGLVVSGIIPDTSGSFPRTAEVSEGSANLSQLEIAVENVDGKKGDEVVLRYGEGEQYFLRDVNGHLELVPYEISERVYNEGGQKNE